MDLHTRAMPVHEAVPDGRIKRWREVPLMRGRQRVCQSGMTDRQKDRHNRGGFFYSD